MGYPHYMKNVAKESLKSFELYRKFVIINKLCCCES